MKQKIGIQSSKSFIIKVCINGTFHLLADFYQTKFNLNNKVLLLLTFNDNFLKTVAVQNLKAREIKVNSICFVTVTFSQNYITILISFSLLHAKHPLRFNFPSH